MDVSIIVPVLNEAVQIRPFLRHLCARAPGTEVIVIDGGSNDGTADLAADLCDRVITTKRGRPFQMNTGASIARGDILWFLHADNEAPSNCIEAITTALSNERTVGGCFRIRIPKMEWIYRVHDGLAHYIGKILRVRCGIHGIFARRSAFDQVGGYPDVPLMEDVKLFQALQIKGRLAWLSERLLLSCRRHEQVGVYRYTFICALIVALYCLRVPLRWLASTYAWLVPLRVSSRHHRALTQVEDELFTDFRYTHETVIHKTA